MNQTLKHIALAALTIMGGVNQGKAQTQAELDAGHKFLRTGYSYSISTNVSGTDYYLTTSGTLTATVSDAGVFKFTQRTAADQYTYEDENGNRTGAGWYINIDDNTRFTNPAGNWDSPEKGSSIRQRSTSNGDINRDMEAQVFFYNGSNFAVRSTNNWGSSWGANTYWDVDDSGELPNACYNITNGLNGTPQYIWQLKVVGVGLTEDEAVANAMNVLEDFTTYNITTTVNNTKYYLNSAGTLSETAPDEPFIFRRSYQGSYKENSAWYVISPDDASHKVSLFTNPDCNSSGNANNDSWKTSLRQDNAHGSGNNYREYESQVFAYDDLSDKWAIRATNLKESSWGANVWWNVDASGELPNACYDLDNRETKHYVWNVEKTAQQPTFYYLVNNRFHEANYIRLTNSPLFVKNSSSYSRTSNISEAAVFYKKAVDGKADTYTLCDIMYGRYMKNGGFDDTKQELNIVKASAQENPDKDVCAIKMGTGTNDYLNASAGLLSDQTGLGKWSEDAGSRWLFVPIEEADMTVTISTGGYTTMTPIYSHVSIPEGVTVYKAKTNDAGTSVVLSELPEGTTIPRGTGVIVAGEAGQTYTFPHTDETEAIEDNALKGVTMSKTVESDAYALGVKDKQCFFGPWKSEATMPKGKAYLRHTAAGGNNVRLFLTFADNAETAIESTAAAPSATSPAYNLAGQRVDNAYRGIVIVNGKKILKR